MARDQPRQASKASKFRLVYLNDALSAELSDAALGEILAELSRQSGISVYFSGAGAAEKITARFENMPLEQGIRRILGHNYTLRYHHAHGSPGTLQAAPRLTEIRVLSRGLGPVSRQARRRLAAPVVRAVPQVSADGSLQQWLQQAQQAAQPGERIAALQSLAGLDNPSQGLPAFAAALQDADPKVREVALRLVGEKGISVPVKSLHGLAQEDADPALRIKAWNRLAEQTDPRVAAGYLAQAMTQEQDPEVKGQAKRLLQKLLIKGNSRQRTK